VGSLAMNEPGVIQITPPIISCLAYQAIWVAFITYLAWFWLVRTYPASRLASFTFLTPLFGVIAGGLLLDEPITNILLLSLVLVSTGIYLVNRPVADQGLEPEDVKT
jgi:drug/metabolite transporter (DMT)-like permease